MCMGDHLRLILECWLRYVCLFMFLSMIVTTFSWSTTHDCLSYQLVARIQYWAKGFADGVSRGALLCTHCTKGCTKMLRCRSCMCVTCSKLLQCWFEIQPPDSTLAKSFNRNYYSIIILLSINFCIVAWLSATKLNNHSHANVISISATSTNYSRWYTDLRRIRCLS